MRNASKEELTHGGMTVIANREAARLARRRLLQNVNAEVRALARRVDQVGEWRWPFVCECGEEECDEPVLVTLQLYDDLRHDELTLLADGHPGCGDDVTAGSAAFP
jgi:hypothetical protein